MVLTSISSRKLLSLLLLGLLLLNCAARQPGERDEDEPALPEEGFDPFAYVGDTEIVTVVDDRQQPAGADSSWYTIASEEPGFSTEVFRVQLFAGQNYYDAAMERDLALEVFTERVRINFVSPYYRVEAGNFVSLTEAEKFLKRAKALGYRKSWVVEEPVDSLFWIQLAADTLAVDSLGAAPDSLLEPAGEPR
jgi:hypothetical protein